MQENKISTKNISPWLIIVIYWLFIFSALIIGAGKYLIILFPLTSVAVGLFLYFNFPLYYLELTIWLLFFSPLIRRIIDYQFGYLTPGPWNLVLLLVSSISLLSLIKYLPRSLPLGGLPFIFCFGSVLYGLALGIVQVPITTKFIPFSLQWIAPIAFAFHLTINWQHYMDYRRIIQRTFYSAVIVMGFYGILQFLLSPGWDQFFLINSPAQSFGNTESFQIRVWSTMESPHTFATAMAAGSLIIIGCKNLFVFPVIAFGFISFFY